MKYRVLNILRGTTVDGPGFRTSIYLAGCSHFCPGCHNQQSWDKDNGKLMDIDEIMAIVREEDFNVTLSGGDPLFNPKSTQQLIKTLKDDGRNVWVYTGFTWEQILASPILKSTVCYADVIVDGPFIESLKDTDLLFRGSSNQRLIDVQQSLHSAYVYHWDVD